MRAGIDSLWTSSSAPFRLRSCYVSRSPLRSIEAWVIVNSAARQKASGDIAGAAAGDNGSSQTCTKDARQTTVCLTCDCQHEPPQSSGGITSPRAMDAMSGITVVPAVYNMNRTEPSHKSQLPPPEWKDQKWATWQSLDRSPGEK